MRNFRLHQSTFAQSVDPVYMDRITPPHLHTAVEDAIASEFLIPQAALKAYSPKFHNLSQIFDFKIVYKVSTVTTEVSLARADILSDVTYKRRCSALNQQGFKHGELNGIPHFERSRVFDRAFDKKPQVRVPQRCGNGAQPALRCG